MTNGSLAKEFHKLLKNVDNMSDGQATVSDWDDENMSSFSLQVKPNGGLYKGGTFLFTVILGEEFPSCAPQVRCETPIYHPNIDPTETCETNICLNMFEESEWSDGYGMDGVIQGVLFLFYEPNVGDPLSPYFDGSTDMEEYETNVLQSLKGEIVEGVQYEWNYVGTKEDYVEANEGVRNDNSGMPENVPKGDNTAEKDATVKEVAEMVSEMCNITDNNEAVVSTNEELSENLNSDSQKASTAKLRDGSQATEDLGAIANQPDLIPEANADCSGTCPDVVAFATELKRQGSVPCQDLKTTSVQRKISDLFDTQRRSSVSLHCYDSLLPEMGLVFAVLNNVTRSIKT